MRSPFGTGLARMGPDWMQSNTKILKFHTKTCDSNWDMPIESYWWQTMRHDITKETHQSVISRSLAQKLDGNGIMATEVVPLATKNPGDYYWPGPLNGAWILQQQTWEGLNHTKKNKRRPSNPEKIYKGCVSLVLKLATRSNYRQIQLNSYFDRSASDLSFEGYPQIPARWCPPVISWLKNQSIAIFPINPNVNQTHWGTTACL